VLLLRSSIACWYAASCFPGCLTSCSNSFIYLVNHIDRYSNYTAEQQKTIPSPPMLIAKIVLKCFSLRIVCKGRNSTQHGNNDPPLHSEQRGPKPSNFPSHSDSQHSFTYLWKFSESSTLISLIFVVKSEFSRILGVKIHEYSS
jgi:hypothetical protein